MWNEEIHTERLMLRKPRREDAAEIHARYATDPEVTRFLSWKTHASPAESDEIVGKFLEGWEKQEHLCWVIIRKSEGDLVGTIGLTLHKVRASAGYCLARDAWGKGYAAEALRALIDEAFRQGLYRVDAHCDVENRGSERVMQKAGMQHEGVLRRYCVLPNCGEDPRDLNLYAIVR